jgi:hypothetical protein
MAGLGTPPAPGAPAELPGLDAPPLPSGAMPIAASLPTPVFPEPVAEGAWPPASEPTPDKVVVSGAGVAGANGEYFWDGDLWRKGGYIITHNADFWSIFDASDPENPNELYVSDLTPGVHPGEGETYDVSIGGTPPAPTITFVPGSP